MKEFAVGGERLEMVAQTLLQMKSNERSTEGAAESLVPLSCDMLTVTKLEDIALRARQNAADIQALYSTVAKVAFTLETKDEEAPSEN